MNTDKEKISSGRKGPALSVIVLGALFVLGGVYLVISIVRAWISFNSLFSLAVGNLSDIGYVLLFLVAIGVGTGLFFIMLGTGIIRQRLWTYFPLRYVLALNVLGPLNEFVFFGPQKFYHANTSALLVFCVAPLIWWFLTRKATRRQLYKKGPFRWKSLYGLCLTMYTVFIFSPFVGLVIYKYYLKTQYGMPFWPVANKIKALKKEEPTPLPKNYKQARFFNVIFPISMNTKVNDFYNRENDAISNFISLWDKRKKVCSLIVFTKGPYLDAPKLCSLFGVSDPCALIKAWYSANWSLLPLFFRQMSIPTTTEFFVRDNECLKIAAFPRPDPSGKRYCLETLIYFPQEKVCRIVVIGSREAMSDDAIFSFLYQIDFCKDFCEEDIKAKGIIGDLQFIELYDKEPTPANGVRLAERLIQNKVTSREHIAHLLQYVLIEQPENPRAKQLLNAVNDELKKGRDKSNL